MVVEAVPIALRRCCACLQILFNCALVRYNGQNTIEENDQPPDGLDQEDGLFGEEGAAKREGTLMRMLMMRAFLAPLRHQSEEILRGRV
jgi:hypothetical protein